MRRRCIKKKAALYAPSGGWVVFTLCKNVRQPDLISQPTTLLQSRLVYLYLQAVITTQMLIFFLAQLLLIKKSKHESVTR